ncbi:MAG: lamin tail domain-containing protein [Candidatus Brachytrichaceae bacterium NZ_4S206]
MHYPDEYAAFEGVVGSAWLTRREMFERAERAYQAQAAAEHPTSSRWLGPTVVVTLALMVTCVILAAIAAAFVLSPSLARTRRAISAAYQPTPTPVVTRPVVATDPAAVGTLDSPLPLQPTEAGRGADNPGDDDEPRVPTPTATPEPAQPDLIPTLPATPASVLDSPLPRPEVTLPPTFTPPPPLILQPTATGTLQPVSEVAATPLPSPTPQAQTPVTATAPPAAPPAMPAEPTPQPTPTPLKMGSIVFQGTVRILSIQPVGSGPNQSDEYVELYNEGLQQVDLNGWTLKAIRTADNTIIDTYLFGNGAVIAAGQVCRIYTNQLSAPYDCGFSGGFASDEPIWPDNGGARASLFNQGNIEYARFTY